MPIRLATSRPAVKAYLGTLLFLMVSLILTAISATAYALFYYSYVPQVGLEATLHLQYGDVGGTASTTEFTDAIIQRCRN